MLGLLSREPVDEVLQIPPSLLTCGGCQQSIGDRYFLKAIDQYWHEDCLSCDLCGCRLGEVGRRLYYKLGRKLCRRDYLRYPLRHRLGALSRGPGCRHHLSLGHCLAPAACQNEVRLQRLSLSCPMQRSSWHCFLFEKHVFIHLYGGKC